VRHARCTLFRGRVAPEEHDMNNAANNIREHMDVIASDGTRVGTVDKVEGQTIKLAKNDPKAQGSHHWIPMDWVQSVDQHVHLSKPSAEVSRNWQTAAPGPKM
jgi:hypothetical protein